MSAEEEAAAAGILEEGRGKDAEITESA